MKRAVQENNESRSKRQKKASKKCGELGIIESVSLQNFMCHENLKFKFEPNINFIIGQNGSGKSAVLTGIILALGGKSRATGRFSNAKGFIKTGKRRAKIEVVLKNGGPYAYKPDIYGDKIRVVREISVDGGGGYKLYSSIKEGIPVSTHKDELINILSTMDIQIENPVSILTQENSRSFLLQEKNKARNLYQFFSDGTGLSTLNETYEKIRTLKDDAIEELRRKREILPVMEKELKQLKKYLDNAARVSDLQNELRWAVIIEMEKHLQKQEKEVNETEKKLITARRESEKAKDILTKEMDTQKELEKQRAECETVMTTIRNSLAQLKPERENVRTAYRNLEGKLNLYQKEGKKLADDMLALKNSINEIELKSQYDINEGKRQRESLLKELEQQVSNAQAMMQNLNATRNKKLITQHELTSRVDSLKAEVANSQYKKERCKETLQHRQNAFKNKINMFGDQTENILREIQQQSSRFQKIPLGPIGLYLEVKDPKWSSAVETCIAPGLLRSFCCDNNQDSNVLKEILYRYYNHKMPSIIASPYSPTMYDVGPLKAQTQYPTVLDMLDIKHPVIANCLIDQLSIENLILVEDRQTAMNLMLNRPPRNCFKVYLPNCDEIHSNPYRYYSSDQRCQNLLTSIRQDEIKNLEREYQKAVEEYEEKAQSLEKLQNEFRQLPEEIKSLDQKIVQSSVHQKKLSQKIQDLQVTEEPKDAYCLKEDLQQAQSEYDKMKTQISNCEHQIVELKTKLKNIESEIQSKIQLLQTEGKKFDDIFTKINNIGQKKETLQSGIKKYEQEIKELRLQHEKLKAEVDENKKNYEEVIKNAEEDCSQHHQGKKGRIDTDRSPATIRRLLEETKKVVEQQNNCDRASLQKSYYEKLEKIKKAKGELQQKEITMQTINRMIDDRRRNFENVRSNTQTIINMTFRVYLQDFFHGTLEFNNKDRTLNLVAHPKKSGPGAKSTGKTSSLSGGERSLVTIAFLLAMWDRIRSPFKILDEYDVFMDSDNRHYCINLLIKRAEEMMDSQFIFLSPLDLPKLENAANVRIHKMRPPERLKKAA